MIKVLVMDVDGTLTDGKIYLGPSGEVFKAFNIKDGYGIKNICKRNGIIPVVLTGRSSKIVSERCRELDICHVYQGLENKVQALIGISLDLNIALSHFAYIGDDLNDEDCILLINEEGGLTGCPSDGNPMITAKAKFKCKKSGGDGAVREFIDFITTQLTNEEK